MCSPPSDISYIWNPVAGLSGYTSRWIPSQHLFHKLINWDFKANMILKTAQSFWQDAHPSHHVLPTLHFPPAEAAQVPLCCLPNTEPIWSPVNTHVASCPRSGNIYLSVCITMLPDRPSLCVESSASSSCWYQTTAQEPENT